MAWHWAPVLLCLVMASAHGGESTGNCQNPLPPGAVAATDFYLCQQEGGTAVLACRDYRLGDRRFRMMFRGGKTPQAIEERMEHDVRPILAHAPVCDIERPPAIPRGAVFFGVGVCEANGGCKFPCALFEHAAARESEVKRHLVFYQPDGSGVRHIETMVARANNQAMEAELAAQIAQTFLHSACCAEQAQEYAMYAARLFPFEPRYRAILLSAGQAAHRADPRTPCSGMGENQ